MISLQMDQTSKDMINHYRLIKDYVSMEKEYEAVIEFLQDKLNKQPTASSTSLRKIKKLENEIKVLTYNNKILESKNQKLESKIDMLEKVKSYVK